MANINFDYVLNLTFKTIDISSCRSGPRKILSTAFTYDRTLTFLPNILSNFNIMPSIESIISLLLNKMYFLCSGLV